MIICSLLFMDFKDTATGNYFLETRLGPLKITLGATGLSQFFFEDCSRKRLDKDVCFRDTFINWLTGFQNTTASKRWNLLSPGGTDFQQQVWRELLKIPLGSRVSYGEIASRIGRPTANRAVGSAVGANPISLLIPCHRVVPAGGGIGNYRWNPDRKQALLEMEQVPNASVAQLFQFQKTEIQA